MNPHSMLMNCANKQVFFLTGKQTWAVITAPPPMD